MAGGSLFSILHSDSKDTKTLKDILDVLNASNAKGKLVNIKAAKLGNPVQKLSNHDDPDIKAAAAELVSLARCGAGAGWRNDKRHASQCAVGQRSRHPRQRKIDLISRSH